MSGSTYTFRIDQKLKEEFIEAAKAVDRPGAQLLRDFIRDFVKQQQEVVERDAHLSNKAQEGQGSSKDGDVVSNLMAEFASLSRRRAKFRQTKDSE